MQGAKEWAAFGLSLPTRGATVNLVHGSFETARPTPTPTPAMPLRHRCGPGLRPTQSPSLQASPPGQSTGKHAVTSRCASKGYGRQLACGLVCAFEHDPDPHTHTHATATSHPNDRLCPLAAGSTYTRALVTRPIHTAHTAHSRRNYYPTRPRSLSTVPSLPVRDVVGPRASLTGGFGNSQRSHQPPAPTLARPSASWSSITISMPSVGMPRSARSAAV